MEKLNKEYIELLSAEGNTSYKFWALEKRIQDKKDCGVQCEMSRSNQFYNISSFRRRITERVKKGISGNGSCTTRQRIETLLVNGVDIKTGVSHKKYDLRLFLFAERK